jgi:dTDP-4-amino-4,6-dideoxygalactose transaminase
MDMARQYHLFVVEDVAQAFGGTWERKKLGSIGNTGAFSFFPSKNLGGFGDGGMTSTDDDEIGEIVRMLIKHGGRDKYNVDHIGYNARLDTLQAAIILTKFKHIDDFNHRRRNIAELYNKGLEGIAGLSIPLSAPLPSVHHVYNQYTIRILDGKRDALQDHLKAKNISTMVYYPVPLHQMKIFKGKNKNGNPPCVNAENAVREVLSLPIEPLQDKGDTQYIVDCIREYFLNTHA